MSIHIAQRFVSCIFAGSFFMLVTACASSTVDPVPGAGPATSGGLDTTFGTAGKTVLSFGTHINLAQAVLIQPDGKILLGCLVAHPADSDYTLVRLMASGAPDISFGSGGVVVNAIGSGYDYLFALAQDASGLVYAAGFAQGATSRDFAVARYTAEGQIDYRFGINGHALVDFTAGHDEAWALALQPDGKPVLAGVANDGAKQRLALARLDANGDLDPGFGHGGKVILTNGADVVSATAAAIQPDGKIVVAAYCLTGVNEDFLIARVLANGQLDPTFGTGGFFQMDFAGTEDVCYALDIAADGTILVGGYACDASHDADMALIRLTPAGALDPTFGSGGRLTVEFGLGHDKIRAVKKVGNAYYAAGFAYNGTDNDMALVRVSTAGVLDTSIGASGRVLLPLGAGEDQALAMAVQPDGKLVLAGQVWRNGNWDIGIVRWIP